jgi:hypothetical protein
LPREVTKVPVAKGSYQGSSCQGKYPRFQLPREVSKVPVAKGSIQGSSSLREVSKVPVASPFSPLPNLVEGKNIVQEKLRKI